MHTVCGYMPSLSEVIGARLKRLREERGTEGKPMKQLEAASMAGVEPRQWQRWEKGRHQPRPETLTQIADRFGISVEEFYEGADEGESPSQLARIEAKLDLLLQQISGQTEDELAAALIQQLEKAAQRAAEQGEDTPADSRSARQ